jgi:hypothetical protein
VWGKLVSKSLQVYSRSILIYRRISPGLLKKKKRDEKNIEKKEIKDRVKEKEAKKMKRKRKERKKKR